MSIDIIENNLRFGVLTPRTSTKRLFYHHAAAEECSVEQIHSWHVSAGYNGIGYHYLVRKDGSIHRGRPEDTIGAHALGNNSDSIGICFEGNFEIEEMPEAQKLAGIALTAYLKSKYKIEKVLRHCDVNSTACPGRNFPFEEITGAEAAVHQMDYRAHIQTYDWQKWKSEGDIIGVTGQSKRLEAFVINSKDIDFEYKAHIQNYGDTPWMTNGFVCGTMGLGKRIEAIWIKASVAIRYRVHMQGTGWSEWYTNGQMAGTIGESRRIEAIEIDILG